MTESLPPRPFVRRMYADRADLLGARWWHESLQHAAPDLITRRRALIGLALALGPVAGGGLLAWALSERDEVDITMDALELQRRQGWDAGHAGAGLSFPNWSTVDVDHSAGWRDALTRLASELAPAQASLLPFYVPTLLQAPADPLNASLRAVLRPVAPPADDPDLHRGEAIRALFDDPEAQEDVGVIVDVPGPSAVAVAAGLLPRFDPVFVFDNWPHPLGVVPSHVTLGALLWHRPLFLRDRAAHASRAPPVFVLDRNRLAHYRDDQAQFDNRYVARLPTAANLRSLGIRRLLYVTPSANELRELDDLNDDFVAFRDASIDVKILPLTDLMRPEQRTPQQHGYSYGGHAHGHFWFWRSYGWHSGRSVQPAAPPPTQVSRGAQYRPAARQTIFSSRTLGGGAGIGKQKPSGFGRVSVRTSKSSGHVTAVHTGRSGSFGRAGGGGSS